MNKVLLLILDGWGIGKDYSHNAILQAKTPYWDKLSNHKNFSTLSAKEGSVGLSPGHLSNSEVGHTAIGAGRVVESSAFAADEDIKKNKFFDKKIFEEIEQNINDNQGKLHLVGMLSDGGVHSHINHLLVLIEWTKNKNIKDVVLHLFLDGRDMAPMSANKLWKVLEKNLDKNVRVATLTGRAIAMDRTENWDRTVETFETLTKLKNTTDLTPLGYIEKNYTENIGDEFMNPARFTNDLIEDNDNIIFFNFRADRMKQLVKLFLAKAPNSIQKNLNVPKNLLFTSMARYDENFCKVGVVFERQIPKNNLGEWVSQQGLKHLKLTETEKYAHVTYFLNGGQEVQYKNEERLIVPSLGLKNYASQPEMSLPEVTKSLVRALTQKHFDLITCNIANGDMVGHSGDFAAAKVAVNHVDTALSQIFPVAEKNGYQIVLTADHGNIEHMETDGSPHTAHTFNDVPLVVAGTNLDIHKNGHLHQVAPTVLELLGLSIPTEMTSESLIKSASRYKIGIALR